MQIVVDNKSYKENRNYHKPLDYQIKMAFGRNEIKVDFNVVQCFEGPNVSFSAASKVSTEE